MFWSRRKSGKTTTVHTLAQTTAGESQEASQINKGKELCKERSVESNEEKYIAAINKLEKKLQCNNTKYLDVFSKLEKKVQHYKKNVNVVTYVDVESFSDREYLYHGSPGLPALMAVNGYEDSTRKRPALLPTPVKQPYCHEQDVHSKTNNMCFRAVISDLSAASTISQNALSSEVQSTLSYQDSHAANYTAIKENNVGSEQQAAGEPRNDGKTDKELCSDENSCESGNQRLEEGVCPRERIKSDLVKVYQCNFCGTYFLYFESYQEHKKKCLTCSKCDLTFPSICELYKHVTSKAHKEYFSFYEVFKWTQAQLKLRISKNGVDESDVKKFTSPESASLEKEQSSLTVDSSNCKSLSSSEQKQIYVGTTLLSMPPSSASQESNDSLATSQSIVEHNVDLTKEDIAVPACNKETGESMEQSDNGIISQKIKKNGDCLNGQTHGSINNSTTMSTEKCNGNTHKNKHEHGAQLLPQKTKSNKMMKENENLHRKASPHKVQSCEPSKSKKVHSKSPQKAAKDCMSPQNKCNSMSVEKALNGSKLSKTKKISSKVQPLQRDSASKETESRMITSKSPDKKEEESEDKLPEKHQSISKKLKKHSSSMDPKNKYTSKHILQETKVRKVSHRKTKEVIERNKVTSAKPNLSHSSESLSSRCDKENYHLKNASSSNIQANKNQKNESLQKKNSLVSSNEATHCHKRSHSFEESSPKAIKLLMKTVRVTSDFVVSCRKLNKVPENCPGCSNKIDNMTAVYNTKTNHVSFWCRTCKWDIVFSTTS